jgi:hypothetical protein
MPGGMGSLRSLPDFIRPNAPIDLPGSERGSKENIGTKPQSANVGSLIRCVKCSNLIAATFASCPVCSAVVPNPKPRDVEKRSKWPYGIGMTMFLIWLFIWGARIIGQYLKK